MVIKEEKPLTLVEVISLAKDDEKGEEIKKFLSNFVKMDLDKVKELRAELIGLELIKLKDSYIAKIIDFLPIDAADLNKILSDVSFDADEIAKIVNITQKY